MSALDIAATALEAQSKRVETISNNIANINTTAFNRQRVAFEDLLYIDSKRMGSSSSANDTIIPTGIQQGLGVNTGSIYRIHEQGALMQTGNNLDVAFQGKGWFSVELPSGETAYTRDGSFQLNDQGEIVTTQGYRVLPGITIPTEATNVNINNVGIIEITLDGQTTPQEVGQLEIAIFPNRRGLHAEGGNLFTETAASGAPVIGQAGEEGFGKIQQGFVEKSNVNAVSEVTELLSAQRGFELASKIVDKWDQMMQTVTQS